MTGDDEYRDDHDEDDEPSIGTALLEFATIAGLFALVFSLYFLAEALSDLPR